MYIEQNAWFPLCLYYSYNSNMLIALVSIKPVSPVFLVCCAGVSIILERVFHKSQYSVFELYLEPIVLAPPFSQSFVSARQFFFGLLQIQFWCHRPSQKLVWIVIPKSFQGYPKSSPGINSLASRSSQSEVMPISCRQKTLFLGVFLDEISFPGQTVDFRL